MQRQGNFEFTTSLDSQGYTHTPLPVCVWRGVDRKTGHRIDTNFRIPAKKSKFQVFRIVKYVSKRKDS